MSFARPSVSNLLRPLARHSHSFSSLPVHQNGPRYDIETPADFLRSIGRGADQKLKMDTWDQLFNLTASDLKKAGVDKPDEVTNRTYILWAIKMFRHGGNPKEPTKPPVPPPAPRYGIETAADFLKAIGRGAEQKVKVETWDGLFSLTGREMTKAGVPIKDRRYVLWALEKYRQGGNPKEFAVPPTPKKKIRGWGPKIQLGRKIR